MDALFKREAPKKENVTIRGSRRGGYFWLVEVRDDVNSFLGDAHLDVFGFLGMAEGNPSGGIFKSTDGADTPKDETHHAADEVAVAPAGGLESGPEVAVEASFARLAVIEEKPVGAGHPIIVKVVNNRNLEVEGGLIDGGGKRGKDVVNYPKVEAIVVL